MIDRRTFLVGTGAVLLAAPLAAEAQSAGKAPRIGYLSMFSSSNPYPPARHSGKDCTTSAGSRVRTSLSNGDLLRAMLDGSPTSRPSWSVSGLTSSLRRLRQRLVP